MSNNWNNPKPWGPPGTPGGAGRPPNEAGFWQNSAAPAAPEKADYEQPFRNPTYANPGPSVAPNNGYWPGTTRQRLAFGAPTFSNANPAVAGNFNPVFDTTFGASGMSAPLVRSKAVWTTPLFDTMPQLRGSQGATPGDSEAIWIPGSALAVQLEFLEAFGYEDTVAVYALEWSAFTNTSDPLDVRPTQLPQEITSYCWDGWGTNQNQDLSSYVSTAVLYFSPPAGQRYWRLSLILDRQPYNYPPTSVQVDPYILLSALMAGQ